jgi:excinuclease ABC subunit B
MSNFKLSSKFEPAGDQPKAISSLISGLQKGMRAQTLLGVTGSGKTFTVANIINVVQKPTLVIAHNKTLAAQLAQEYQEFFPENAVHYFVSYYDYYQPEAYMPVTDTYIEKDAQINEEIDRLRHASTQSLLTRKDVIIVASVSCIYGLGSPEEYEKENLKLSVGDRFERRELLNRLVAIHYERTSADLTPGQFRSIGGRVEVMPVSERLVFNIELEGGKIKEILKIDPVSGTVLETPKNIFLFPTKHFLTEETKTKKAIKDIRAELAEQLKIFEAEGKFLEAERIKRRTTYDLAMIQEIGYCSGIENYSRHLSGKKEGEPPETLLSYFPHNEDGSPDFLTVIDESHVTLTQLQGMFAGDASRKKTLVEYGFRLPSAKDNRPLKYPEFTERIGQVIYTSATPGEMEKTESEQTVEQVIRPTGLLDPELEIRPILAVGNYPGQIQDFIAETIAAVEKGGRVIATTLTKKMAEDLSVYLKEKGIKSEYLHSDIKTIDRIKILTEFRKGAFDCLVGVNLLREGLDLPEVTFIGILDADKEGFLRSETSLIQTIGRAARNVEGKVILYADHMTGSIERAVGETNRRRKIQMEYNEKHGITPQTIIKHIRDITEHLESEHEKAVKANLLVDREVFGLDREKLLKAKKKAMEGEPLSDELFDRMLMEKLLKVKRKQMAEAVKELDFETAAILRDEIHALEK